MKVFAGLAIIGVWLAAVVGWVMNIVALVHAPALVLWGALEVVRVIGIFIAPVGAILGYF